MLISKRQEVTSLNKLIRIELKKILHKKSIYIIFSLILIFIVLNNILILQEKSKIDKNAYLNDAILEYKNNQANLDYFSNKENLSYQEKIEYNQNLSSLKLNEYIIENKKNINDYTTLNYQIRTTLEDYEIFIIIIILIISSSILAEEINKGTIKLLLIKPYKRNEIILSKYLTILIIIFSSIIFLYIMQLLIGGLFLGFDSLQEKVVIYNYEKSQIMCYNIFGYTLIRVISKIPMLILISTLSYLISIISSNNTISLTITMLIYIFTQSINSLAITFNVKIMKYLLTTNWNFTEYLFGNIPIFKYINLKLSIIVCIAYLIIMIITSFIIFNKKDIKNI